MSAVTTGATGLEAGAGAIAFSILPRVDRFMPYLKDRAVL